MNIPTQKIENVTTYFANEEKTIVIGKVVENGVGPRPFTALHGTMISDARTFEDAQDYVLRQTQIVRPS